MKELLELFDAVAELNKIELKNAPRRILEELERFISMIEVKAQEIDWALSNSNIRFIFDRIP